MGLAIGLGLGLSFGQGRAGGVIVAPPLGFGWSDYPFEIRRKGTLFASLFSFTSAYDATRPSPDLTIYVGDGGSDANDGLTYATRKRSLNAAVLAAQSAAAVGLVLAVGGVYKKSAGHALDAPTITKQTIIESYNGAPVTSIHDVVMPAWVRYGATDYYTSAYTTEVPGTFVMDLSNVDAAGDPQPLAPLIATPASPTNPISEMDARFAAFPALGCSYHDAANKVVWVRTFDGRAPDANLIVTEAVSAQIELLTPAQRVWTQDVKTIGGSYGLHINGANIQTYRRRCVALAGHSGGVRANTSLGRMISEYCRTKHVLSDNFSYTKGFHAELGCVSDWSAWNGSATSNATTLHETARLISVNSRYERAARVIAHIDTARHWMLGSSFGNSRITAGAFGSSIPLYLSGAENNTKMWVDCCEILPGSVDVSLVNAPAEFYYSALTGTLPTGTGVIAPYGREYVFVNAEAAALVARFATPLDRDRKELIDTLVGAFKAAGVWSKLDALYILAAHDSQAALLNWIADQYNLIPVNSPVFKVDRGFVGHLDTGFAPGTGKMLRDDHHMAVWDRDDTAAAKANLGSARLSIGTRQSNNLLATRSANATAQSVANSNGSGFFVVRRNAPSFYKRSRNGVLFADATAASSSFDGDTTIFIGGRNVGGVLTTPTTDQHAVVSMGAYITDEQDAAMYAALNTYLTAVGAA